MAVNMRKQLEPMFEQAWDGLLGTEQVHWSITLLMHPQYGTVLYAGALVLSPIVGMTLNTGLMIPAPNALDEEKVRAYVGEMKKDLDKQTAQALNDNAPPAGPTAPNTTGLGGAFDLSQLRKN